MATQDLGDRLQSVRKRRGLTQRELANLSGVSISLIRQIEQHERPDTRVETLRKLASALRVPTAELMLRKEVDTEASEVAAQWEVVHDALNGKLKRNEAQETPTVDGVGAAVKAALPLFQSNRFTELGTLLPPLLRDADDLGKDGRAVRSDALQLAGLALIQTRQFSNADMALRRALDDATDRLRSAAVVTSLCWLLLRQGKLAETLDLAVSWSDDLEPRLSQATKSELSAWGLLLLSVSAVAIRNSQPGAAEDAMRLAKAAAIAIGREYSSPANPVYAFGPVTVQMKRAENAIIEEQPDRVLRIAECIPAAFKPASKYGAGRSNRLRHRLDVAQAHVMLKSYTEGFGVLQKVRSEAPEWIANQRLARDVLKRIIDRRRSLTADMRDLADFLDLAY